jgi:hypothetical protein
LYAIKHLFRQEMRKKNIARFRVVQVRYQASEINGNAALIDEPLPNQEIDRKAQVVSHLTKNN